MPFIHIFSEFLGQHKTNITVIVVSFLTVVLSVKLVRYEVLQHTFMSHLFVVLQALISNQFLLSSNPWQVQTKKKYKELEKELINTQGQVDQKRNLLKAITDQSFVHEMATKCTKEVNNKTSNVFSFWGRSSSKANMEAQISSVLETQLNNLIGDEGLTEDEKNAKQFEELKQDNGSEIDKIKALTMENSTKEEEGIQIEMMDDASGNKVVKKSVFRI